MILYPLLSLKSTMKYQIFFFEFLANVIMTWSCRCHLEEQRILTFEDVKAALLNPFLLFIQKRLWTRQKVSLITFFPSPVFSLQNIGFVASFQNILMHKPVLILQNLHECCILQRSLNILVYIRMYSWVKSMPLTFPFDVYLFHSVQGSVSQYMYLLSIYMYVFC